MAMFHQAYIYHACFRYLTFVILLSLPQCICLCSVFVYAYTYTHMHRLQSKSKTIKGLIRKRRNAKKVLK